MPPVSHLRRAVALAVAALLLGAVACQRTTEGGGGEGNQGSHGIAETSNNVVFSHSSDSSEGTSPPSTSNNVSVGPVFLTVPQDSKPGPGTITVTNTASVAVGSVEIRLPAEAITSIKPSQGTCSKSGATFICKIDRLRPGDIVTFAVNISPNMPKGTITLRADVPKATVKPVPTESPSPSRR